ncbi:hypothetical protein Plec18170_008592 [Paecilomyces lecythidis]
MSRPAKDAKIEEFFIPADPDDLAEILKNEKMEKCSLYNIRSQWLGSGSKVSERQFVAFRAVWPPMKPPKTLVTETHLYGIDKFWDHAQSIVNSLGDFQKFLDMIESDIYLKDLAIDDQRHPSSLATLRDLHELIGFDTSQRQESARLKRATSSTQPGVPPTAHTIKRVKNMVRSSSRGSLKNLPASEDRAERPPTEQAATPEASEKQFEAPDEATVNAAMIVFLRSFSGLVANSKFEYLFERVSFTATFGECSFTAYTDGAFRNSQQILVIIEVKKASRKQNLQAIQMQETAEMTGWLKQFEIERGFMKNHPVIISQDHNELYVTFCSFHQDYLRYLKNKNAEITKNTYMSLQSYGPFYTNDKQHMKDFAILITSMTLAANAA